LSSLHRLPAFGAKARAIPQLSATVRAVAHQESGHTRLATGRAEARPRAYLRATMLAAHARQRPPHLSKPGLCSRVRRGPPIAPPQDEQPYSTDE
jgi:hypothetical protein